MRYRFKNYQTFEAEQLDDGRWVVRESGEPKGEDGAYYTDSEFQKTFELAEVKGSTGSMQGH